MSKNEGWTGGGGKRARLAAMHAAMIKVCSPVGPRTSCTLLQQPNKQANLQALAVADRHQGPLGNACLDAGDHGVLAAGQEGALAGAHLGRGADGRGEGKAAVRPRLRRQGAQGSTAEGHGGRQRCAGWRSPDVSRQKTAGRPTLSTLDLPVSVSTTLQQGEPRYAQQGLRSAHPSGLGACTWQEGSAVCVALTDRPAPRESSPGALHVGQGQLDDVVALLIREEVREQKNAGALVQDLQGGAGGERVLILWAVHQLRRRSSAPKPPALAFGIQHEGLP